MILKERLLATFYKVGKTQDEIDNSQAWQTFHDIVGQLAETPAVRAVKYAKRPHLQRALELPLTANSLPQTLTSLISCVGTCSEKLRVDPVCSFQKGKDRASLKFHLVNSEGLKTIIEFALCDQKPKISVFDLTHYANKLGDIQAKLTEQVTAVKKLVANFNHYPVTAKWGVFLELAEYVASCATLPYTTQVVHPDSYYDRFGMPRQNRVLKNLQPVLEEQDKEEVA